MAFPSVVSTNTSFEDSLVTSHDISLPGTYEADDLLVVACRTGSGNLTHTMPAGWELVTENFNNGRTTIWQKQADGSEGSTVILTTTVGRYSAHASYALRSSLGAFSIEGVGINVLDCPALTPSWGSADVLWLIFGSERGDRTFTGIPANYANQITADTTAGTSTEDAHITSARRELAASSEDPGAFTISAGASGPQSLTVGVIESEPVVITQTRLRLGLGTRL